ncbi:MAG: hypothetical protein IPH07_24655 [Deltaproteobacteria bacterium]|nr:hypothetical protein [Deltaproteobacteria bacterium]
MTTLAWPSDEHFAPSDLEWKLKPFVIVNPGLLAAATRTRAIAGPVWWCSMTLGAVYPDEQAEREAFFARVRGSENRARFWHFKRPVPRGTLRGAPTLSSTVTAGATSATCSAASGATLRKGDMLGLGSSGQLVMVVTDATESGGTITWTFEPPARTSVASGTAVVWDAPTVLFMLNQDGVGLPYRGNDEAPGIDLEWIEDTAQ